MIFLKMRTVTRERGLILSETVPDNFILVCENAYPGRMDRRVAKRADNKNFLIAFRVADGFGKLNYKVNEFFRSGKS